MTDPRASRRRVRRLLVVITLAGAIFGYRHYRLANAPAPSWDNPG